MYTPKNQSGFHGVDQESPRPDFHPSADRKGSKKWDWFQFFVVSSIVVLFILVIILFSTYEPIGKTNNKNALQSSDSTASGSTVYISTSTSSSKLSSRSFSSSSSSSSSSSISANTAVSFNQNGVLQRGGGTSIYKNILTLEATCSQYLQMDAILNNTYVFSAANSSGTLFQIVQIGGSSKDSALDIGLNNNKATLLSTQYVSQFSLYEIVGLSITEGLMVGLTQDFSASKNISYVVAFQVNRNQNYIIKFGDGIQYSTDEYSVNPQIARLSENSFAMTYYSYPSPNVMTRVGVINRQTLEITLSKPKVFASNKGYGLTATVVGLSPYMYLLTYYDSKNGGGSKLQTKIATVTMTGDNLNPLVSVIVTNSSVVSETSKLIYYLSATRIDDFTAVVCYTDANTGQGLTAQIISVTNQYALDAGVEYKYMDDFDNGYAPHQVLYGSTWEITMGRSQTNTVQGYLDFSVQSYTADGRFVVVYTDMTNDAALTVIMGEITSSNNIRRVTPNMIVNRPKDLIVNQAYQWSAVGVGRNESFNGQMAIVYAVSSNACTENILASVSVLETKPQHIGVVASDGSQIAISGLAPLSFSTDSSTTSSNTNNGNIQSLKPFRYYYTDTMGRLFTVNEDVNNVGNSPTGSLGTSYMGRSLPTLFSPDSNQQQNGDTFISPRFQEFIEIQEPGSKQRPDQGVIVTLDSQVGVAVGTSSLLIIPNFNGGSYKG